MLYIYKTEPTCLVMKYSQFNVINYNTVVTSFNAESCSSLISSTKKGETAIDEVWRTAVSVRVWICKSSAKSETTSANLVYRDRTFLSRTSFGWARFLRALPV